MGAAPRRLIERLLRLLGGDPARIAALAWGFRKAAAGRIELAQERHGGTGIALEAIPALIGTLLGLVSVMLTIVIVIAPEDAPVTTLGLAALQFVLCVTLAPAIAVPGFLAEDDARAIGWWPVSRRDLALARLLVVMRPVLQASAVLCGLPLLGYAIRGPVPVVSSALLAIGFLLHAFAIGLGTTVILAGTVALLGRRRGRRVLQALLGAGLLAFFAVSLSAPFLAPKEGGRKDLPAKEVVAALAWTPPGMASAWGRMLSDPRAAPPALALAAIALGAIPLALRFVAAGSTGDRPEKLDAHPRPAPLVALTELVLRPFTRGREGWAVRRLWAAHVRDDVHHGFVRWLPLLVVGGACGLSIAPDSVFAQLGATSVFLVRPLAALPLAAVYAALVATVLQSSGDDHRAAWLLAQSELDPSAVARAMRGAGRALFLAPLLLIEVVLHARLGTPPLLAVSDLVNTTLAFEVTSTLLQSRYLVWPFSRAWGSPPDDAVIILGVCLVPLSAITLMWMTLVHDRFLVGKPLTWALLAFVLVVARRLHAQALAERGLRLEIAPPA